ncbi:response regulator [Caulobacter sp. CCNWLY153]|uniref:Response regulator n=1 Tax=Caulobacter radicis TaxID=2172650 RepID=A0A2T9JMB3_9CAUL|nr:response regulator [Caulobacter radicis]PVM84804.1 response regulator [Caulobacter radicis]
MLNSDRILIVDDEFIIAQTLSIYVEDLGLAVCGMAASAEEAVAIAVDQRPFIVLMDMRLQGERDGVDASREIHERVGSKVIFITGSREPATLTRIEGDHPAAVLFKPVSEGELIAVIRKLLDEAPDRSSPSP